jgi:hypothetical protein
VATRRYLGEWLTIASRWLARLLGLLASGPFLLFLVFLGATVCPRLSWSSPQGMPLFCILIMATVGVLIAWRWEMVGGLIVLLSASAVHVLVYLGSGRAASPPTLMVSVPYFVAGMLFLIAYWGKRQVESRVTSS